jgi:simple sugar transport system permease protein
MHTVPVMNIRPLFAVSMSYEFRCLWASLLFGAAGAISPALQSVGVTQGYYLFSAAPYVLTLALMIATCSPARSLRGAPGELGAVK